MRYTSECAELVKYPIPYTTCSCAAAAGVTSQVAEVQALALATLARIVEKAGPERIRPHLPELVPALLEALSGLEVAAAPSGPRPCWLLCCCCWGFCDIRAGGLSSPCSASVCLEIKGRQDDVIFH
jgi:hypothetical protein